MAQAEWRAGKACALIIRKGRNGMEAAWFSKIGILGYCEEYFEDALMAPEYFVDLNLDQIVRQILNERRDYNIKRYFYRLPKDPKIAEERVKVLRALEDETLFRGFLRFSDKLFAARAYAARYCGAESELQRQRFLLDCGAAYMEGVQALGEAFQAARKKEEGHLASSRLLCGLQKEIEEYRNSKEYQKFCECTKELSEGFARLRVQLAIVRDKVRVSLEVEEGSYKDELKRVFPEQADRTEYLENPFIAAAELGAFESLVLEALRKNNPGLFGKLREYEKSYSFSEQKEEEGMHGLGRAGKNASSEKAKSRRAEAADFAMNGEAKKYDNGRRENFMEPGLLSLEQQAQVYLAFRLFAKHAEEFGGQLAYPEYAEQFDVREGYDLALLLKNKYSREPVICNDAYYAAGEFFLVVTGPNQGGKTTFARSVGQIVYFSLMGLAAPCSLARIPFFHGIRTHFSVEESLETGRGKLKEELVRLEPMMHAKERGQFVVINELFTTAATYDAYIMGKRVMEHFMRRSCLGIYVTHIQELAKKEPGVVSLSACVDPSDLHIRTYKIRRMPAIGTGYAHGIVEKYHLTYSELKERLKERLGKQGS